MYWNISNVPTAWQDTVLDNVDDPPVSVFAPAAYGMSDAALSPAITAAGLKIRIALASAIPGNRPVRLLVYAANGVKVIDSKTEAHRGDRSVDMGRLANLQAAGIYPCSITIGDKRFITVLAVGK